MWACEKGRAEVVELLVAQGAEAHMLSKVTSFHRLLELREN